MHNPTTFSVIGDLYLMENFDVFQLYRYLSDLQIYANPTRIISPLSIDYFEKRGYASTRAFEAPQYHMDGTLIQSVQERARIRKQLVDRAVREGYLLHLFEWSDETHSYEKTGMVYSLYAKDKEAYLRTHALRLISNGKEGVSNFIGLAKRIKNESQDPSKFAFTLRYLSSSWRYAQSGISLDGLFCACENDEEKYLLFNAIETLMCYGVMQRIDTRLIPK